MAPWWRLSQILTAQTLLLVIWTGQVPKYYSITSSTNLSHLSGFGLKYPKWCPVSSDLWYCLLGFLYKNRSFSWSIALNIILQPFLIGWTEWPLVWTSGPSDCFSIATNTWDSPDNFMYPWYHMIYKKVTKNLNMKIINILVKSFCKLANFFFTGCHVFVAIEK